MVRASRARLPIFLALAVTLCGLVMLASAPPAQGGGTFWLVNSAGDPPIDGFCDSSTGGTCTLREAIIWANSTTGIADTIIFGGPAFAGTSEIHLNSELPYFTDLAGVTVDGSLGSNRVLIRPATNTTVDYGLVFTGADSVGNITVKNFYLTGFVYDSVQVCAKPNTQFGTCDGPAGSITLDNVFVSSNTYAGIDIFGTAIYNVQMTDVQSFSNGGSGIVVQSATDLSGIHFDGGETRGNGGDGYNLSGSFANNISFSGTTAFVNDGSGYQISTDVLNGLTMSNNVLDRNESYGVNVDVAGGLVNASLTDSTFTDNGDHAVFIRAANFLNGLFSGNDFDDECCTALTMGATDEINDVTVQDNTFTVSGAAVVYSSQRGSSNLITGNTISGVSHGIIVAGAESSDSIQVRISRNSMSDVTYSGIDLVKSGEDDKPGLTPNDPGDTDQGPNRLLNFPEFSGVTAEALTGTTCANCLVELFVADLDAGQRGEGVTFLRDATADGNGNFSVSLCGLNKPAGTVVTTTATDPDGNTSEFSINVALIASTPVTCATPSPTQPGQTPTPTAVGQTPSPTPVGQTPSPTPTPTPIGQTPAPTTPGQTPTPTPAPGARLNGDVDCSLAVNPIDSLKVLRSDAGLSVQQAQGCPPIGGAVPASGPSAVWGDVDCDGSVSPVDSLKILRYDAGLASGQQPFCPLIGADVNS